MNEVISTAIALVESAQMEGILLRILGSVAICIQTGNCNRPGRLKDIDVIGRRNDRSKIQTFLMRRGWVLDAGLLLVSELRELYRREGTSITLDVYYGQIDGSHAIEINQHRLLMSSPTISLGDLVLSKLQRHRLRDTDMWDCCSLLSVHMDDRDKARIIRETSERWGLYQDVMINLSALEPICIQVKTVITEIRELIINSNKSARWYIRAILGRRHKWWTEVYDPKAKVQL